MPENKKKNEKRALAPADYSRARTHTHATQSGKRRAKRTVELGPSAPRIMRRPKPRRRPQQVTAQFGAITPSKRKHKAGVSPFAKKKKVQTVKVSGGKLPWTAILTALFSTAVIMAMVINYVRLNELTNDYRAIQSEVVSMAADKKSLEQQVDVLGYKEQAEKYGMVARDRVEKRYIRLQSEDKIVVYPEEGNAFTRFFSDLWQDICSFFGNIFS